MTVVTAGISLCHLSDTCPKCDFKTKHQNGLKIHMKRKHKGDTKTFFETAREMKMHRNTHSYSNISFKEQKCVECDYTCETIESMEVHIGKCCYITHSYSNISFKEQKCV